MRPALRRTVGIFSAAAVTASLTVALANGAAAEATAIPEFKMPKIFGTRFQSDPKHNFNRLTSRHDGILRGWVIRYSKGRAVYVPIKWVRDKYSEGYFVEPPKGRMRYMSRVAPNAKLYSVLNCNKPGDGRPTVDRRGLGNRLCSRKVRDAYLRQGRIPSMITIYRGRIVKIQEIYRP
jgi:hypothetical protein